MEKLAGITEHFQHFPRNARDRFWAAVNSRLGWLGSSSWIPSRSGCADCARRASPMNAARARPAAIATADTRGGFVARFGALRLKIAHTPGKSFLPCRAGQASAPGAAGGDAGWLGGKRTDGLQCDPRSGRRRQPASSGAAQRRMGLPASGWNGSEGGPDRGAAAGPNAGGLRTSPRWRPATAWLSAHLGGKARLIGRSG